MSVVEKLKELINDNAYQVVPAELKGVILMHPGAADVGVTGLLNPLAGELPHAWVVYADQASRSQSRRLSNLYKVIFKTLSRRYCSPLLCH